MSEYVIDEDFDYFLEKFGQPDWQHSVEQATLEYYAGKLPNRLLFYWEKWGFAVLNKVCFG